MRASRDYIYIRAVVQIGRSISNHGMDYNVRRRILEEARWLPAPINIRRGTDVYGNINTHTHTIKRERL